ncbi:MAG: NAD(P)H-hydrate dehydratase [Proteobacteria bacterium]|nr:NAD(P)H-hydrate dehydratase [Pseudomonadota bacterium]
MQKSPENAPSSFEQSTKQLDLKEGQQGLPKRKQSAYKGDFGHVLIVGGDYGMPGSVRLAGEAALRVGAGLVTIATRSEHISVVTARHPELMCYGIKKASELEPLLSRATVIVVGPGLRESSWANQLFKKVMMARLPKVIDAGALDLLMKYHKYADDAIITPHVGEAARLLKTTPTAIQQDRLAAVNALQTYAPVVVLKGAGSLVKGKGEAPRICTAGNPGMASGGMGDILSGVIAGLCAQGLTLLNAAYYGVCIHAVAGDRAAAQGERGLLATDLLPHLRALVNEL